MTVEEYQKNIEDVKKIIASLLIIPESEQIALASYITGFKDGCHSSA